VWKRTVDGQTLSFRLAGINNQNFLMRDEQTGTTWQQVTGKAIHGPLAGRQLELVYTDEISFDIWKQEAPGGTVLAPVAAYIDEYAPKNWVERVAARPTVVSVAGTPLDARTLVVGISLDGADRAFPLLAVLKQWPIQDNVGKTPIIIVVGPDGKSVRAFVSRLDSGNAATDTKALEFYRKAGETWALTDSSGGEWNFQGCAISGPNQDQCLKPVYVLKEFWFDWKNYHPSTTLYKH
jgi:hypothetical protein